MFMERAPHGLTLSVVITTLLGVLWEELWFRGVAFEYACRFYGAIVTAALGGLLFASAHVGPAFLEGSHTAFALLALGGYALGLCVVVFRSFWSAVAFHLAYNTMSDLFPGAEVAWFEFLTLGVIGGALTITVARRGAYAEHPCGL